MPQHDLTLAEQEELQSKYEKLPTGKPHISYSEARCWAECSYRHKLEHVLKLGTQLPSVHMDFGTACHAAIECFLNGKMMNVRIFMNKLKELWEEHEKVLPDQYTVESFKEFGKQGLEILKEFPAWIDTTFPGWELIDAEHYLYEPIEGHPHAFKGFIDIVIRVPGQNGKSTVWVLDSKTCGWGWDIKKKSDPLVRMQTILYRSFWTTKTNTNPKDVKCGFVLLKRTAKKGSHIELFQASVGDVTTKRSLKVVADMVTSVKRGIAIKNKESCKFCQFKETEWCP
jgi:hypothetical protein